MRFRNSVITVLILVGTPFFLQAGGSASYTVSGFVELDVSRVAMKSCVARVEDDSIRVNVYAFGMSDEDLEAFRVAYTTKGPAASMAVMRAEGRHPVPSGYQSHPSIEISLESKAGAANPQSLVPTGVGISGDGPAGDLYVGLSENNYEMEITKWNGDSVAGRLRPADTDMSFSLDFSCPILN